MQISGSTKNNLRIRAIFFLAAFLLLSPAGRLAAQVTSFIQYGVEQGLVQSQVQTLVQDDQGNLWIGTLAGLSRYNGRDFVNFTRKDSLAEDWVTASYKDKTGNLWFGHWAGGVSRYNASLHKFESLKLEEYTHFKTVTAILEDMRGYFWISTEGAGIFIYDPVKNNMFALSKKDVLSSEHVFGMVADANGLIWIATDRGVTVYDQNKNDITANDSYGYISTADGLPSDMITSISRVHNNEIWLGTADKGVVALTVTPGFSVKNGKALVAKMQNWSTMNGLASDFVETICEDHFGNVWIGTTGGGAAKLTPSISNDRTNALTHALIKNYGTRQGLNYFNVKTIYEDREGNVWIGTDIGLNQYRGERFQLFDREDGLTNDIVWATHVDRQGNIWLGTNDGLTKMSFYTVPMTGEKKFTVRNYSPADGLGSNVVLSIYEDEKGNLWFGTGYGGVSMLAPGSEQFVTYTTENGLAGDVVYAINSDTKGNIWFGTKEGASKFDPVNKTFRNYTTAEGLGGDNVYRIFRDSKGQLWFGALGGYLSVFDGSSFKKFDEANGGIAHRFILCINEDHQHNLWFGAYGGGLYEYDGKSFRNFTTKNGMTTDSPYSLMPDTAGYMWVGNSRGLDRFNPKDSSFAHFGRSEGFLGVECNPNAASIDKEGNLWFGTIMGVVKFTPRENRTNVVEPKTSIIGLRVFMKDAAFPDDAKFSYDQNHLTFVFVGISLSSPEKVKYQYKLEGFDKDWSPGYTSLNEAVYSNIPPGEYTFMVRAANNDGLWNKEPAKYRFFVRPPFWQTALFYVIMIVFIIFGIYGFDKMRTRNLRKQKEALEKKVEERTLELALKNQELAEKNREVTDSIRYAKRLQDAMLPPVRSMKKLLPESFLLFKPKDIVSGDFYFFRHIEKDGRSIILLAAVDCTGHGVPGAFMSIITNDMIVEAIRDHELDTPAEILDRLNKLMSDRISNTPGDQRVRDGVDIALCTIDLNTRVLNFAGAFNAMYFFRGKFFSELKADKISIGSYGDDPSKKYVNQTMELQSGDTFYLFSDGYADQFGGPQGKKFKAAQLKALMLSIQDEEMHVQQRILDQTIEKWRGELEQVDDMLVIGVRI